MVAINLTQDSASYFCQLLGPFQWKQEYLIETGVYVNVILLATINSVMFPFTALFNLLLVYMIFFKRKVRRRKSNLSIGYLAITDLAVGVVLQPMFVAVELCRIKGRCGKICVLDFMVWFIGTLLCQSSTSHLVIVAWERYVAIKHALQYEIIVTRKKLLWGSIAAWFIPLLVEGLLFFETNPFVSSITFFVYIFICFSILAYFYGVIFMESKRHRRQIKANTPHDEGGANRSKTQEFRAAKTTSIIISGFAICYLPFIVASAIYLFSFSTSSFNPVILILISQFWTITFVLFNSLINPIIYGWRKKELKKMVADIFAARLNSIETEDAKRKKYATSKNRENPRKQHGMFTKC